jgi:iron-sulfur cluster assembly protein
VNLILNLTEAAAERVKSLMDKSEKPVLGLRVGVSTRGCSGMSYVVEYADEKRPLEDMIEDKGVKIFEDKFHAGFVFSNPNEKGRCGCGESFHV